MADNQTGQERTEQATPKKRSDARKKGDVPRSRELTTAIILMAAVVGMNMSSEWFFGELSVLLEAGFSLTKAQIFDPAYTYTATVNAGLTGLSAVTPFLALLTVVSALGPIAIGGWSFNPAASIPKWNRLDPIAGIKKVFGARGLVEMLKALAKFTLILGFALSALYYQFDHVSRIGLRGTEAALADAGAIVMQIFLISSLATIVIATLDVPFQIWDNGRKLKMTLQEVKDETKQQEGSPEMRGRIRSLQQEVANRRMMEEVPNADVVVTNPSHYSVALRFDPDTMSAPRVVAKGADQIALRIRELAVASGVPILSAPPLARSIFHTTKLNREIPAGLYVAAAQVLAYVFNLKRKDSANGVTTFEDLPIPTELQY